MKAVKEMYNNYRGQLKRGRMEGCGAYQFESGATFEGNFKNGMFHGKGTMHFPCGGKYESTWEDGRDQGGTYVYADGLKLENDKGCLTGWRYCNPVWDRRFYDEIQSGLQPATRTKLAARSESETGKSLHDIPNGCYDVGDGYYDPEEQRVYNYLEEKNGGGPESFRRYVTSEEHDWIVRKCRKGTDEPVGSQQVLDYNYVHKMNRMAGIRAASNLGKFSDLSEIRRSNKNPPTAPHAITKKDLNTAIKSGNVSFTLRRE